MKKNKHFFQTIKVGNTSFINCFLLFIMLIIAFSLQCITILELPQNFSEPNAGTPENPFIISNLGNLRWLSETPEAWGNESMMFYYLQTADIDATETIDWNDGNGFRPIGRVSRFTQNYFFGEYNGNNFIIKDLFINSQYDDFFENSVGFFAGIVNSNIINLRLENIHIAAQFDVGGIAGLAYNSTILNSSVSGIIYADENTFAVGSLIGRADSSTIEFCSSVARIAGSNSESDFSVTGGLIGSMSESILRNSFFNGSIRRQAMNSGGLVGFVTFLSTIEYCYVATSEILPQGIILYEINENEYFPMRFGAISSSVINGSSVSNTFFDRQKTGIRNGIHLALQSKFFDKSIRGLITWRMKRASVFKRSGWDFENVWTINKNVNEGYPYLKP
ncbi:MAG: hypothetical protein FWG98_03745 [Candidatus Cloacimonetes bacterium]|nr:hypothetical protein [Candidatus Cloacimonadota bacterium]